VSLVSTVVKGSVLLFIGVTGLHGKVLVAGGQ